MASTRPGKTVSVPVTVIAGARPKRPRVTPTPPVAKIAKPIVTKPAAPAKPARPPKAPLPEAQRRKMMWGVVAVGATLAVIGWLVTLGPSLRQNSGETKLLKDIANLFKSQTQKSAPAENPEVRSLEQEVFPQFQR